MSKTRRPMPFAAMPVSLFGEAACAMADALGATVETYSLKGGRPMSTADARAFLAAGTGRDSAVWLVMAHTFDAEVVRAGAAAL